MDCCTCAYCFERWAREIALCTSYRGEETLFVHSWQIAYFNYTGSNHSLATIQLWDEEGLHSMFTLKLICYTTAYIHISKTA